jgi:hypothetical protein
MTRSSGLAALMAGFALAAVPALSLAQEGQQYYYRGHMWDGSWHAWFLGPLMMVFWIAIMASLAGRFGRRAAAARCGRQCDRHPPRAVRQGRDRQGGIRGTPRLAGEVDACELPPRGVALRG